jgi:ABC-type iron transport system FetAB ATPase subunit
VSQIGATGRRGDAPLRNSGALDGAGWPGAREAAAPLAAVGVSKRFGVVRALDDVTLAVRSGEILALVGENGAGKSTLVRIFEGVYRPDQGALTAGGAPQSFRSPSDAHALGIRVIHQEPDIVPDLSIAENLFLGDFRRTRGLFLDRADLARRTRDILAEFGLEKDLGPWIRAGDLGPAQRQLMEIMRALRGGFGMTASASSISRTGCAKCAIWRIGWRCCATGGWSPNGRRRSSRKAKSFRPWSEGRSRTSMSGERDAAARRSFRCAA